MFDPKQVAVIEALEPPVIKEMQKVLMAAKEGRIGVSSSSSILAERRCL
jgi:hypothetical protein